VSWKVIRTCAIVMAVLAGSLVLNSCQSRQADPLPTIEFTKIPPAAQGGREKADTIAGRVRGGRPGQQIVIYARSGAWWVQPMAATPFTSIRPDSTWSTQIHLGYEYAALLVDKGYNPAPTVDTPPSEGGQVVRTAIVKGAGSIVLAPTKHLKFSGYDWDVRTIASDRGGSNHPYSADKSGGALYRVWQPPQSQNGQGPSPTNGSRIKSSRLSSADRATRRALIIMTRDLSEVVFDCAAKACQIDRL
jgi:hypothetical protein